MFYIKYQKGFTPKQLTETFLNMLESQNVLIGAVEIKITDYDEDLKPINYGGRRQIKVLLDKEDSAEMKKEYMDYLEKTRYKPRGI